MGADEDGVGGRVGCGEGKKDGGGEKGMLDINEAGNKLSLCIFCEIWVCWMKGTVQVFGTKLPGPRESPNQLGSAKMNGNRKIGRLYLQAGVRTQHQDRGGTQSGDRVRVPSAIVLLGVLGCAVQITHKCEKRRPSLQRTKGCDLPPKQQPNQRGRTTKQTFFVSFK